MRLALGTRRNIPPFALSAVPLLGTLLKRQEAAAPQSAPERPRFNAVVLATAVLLGAFGVGAAWRTPLPPLGWNPVGDDLRRALTDCPGRLYNRYDDGGYVIWFAKDKKVFIDSRQDPFPKTWQSDTRLFRLRRLPVRRYILISDCLRSYYCLPWRERRCWPLTRTWPLLAAMNNSRSSRGSARAGATLGSISARRSFERMVFADPCSPEMAKTG